MSLAVLVLRNKPKLDFFILAQHETLKECIWLPNVLSDPRASLFFCFPVLLSTPCPQADSHLEPVKPFLQNPRSNNAHVTKINTGTMTSDGKWKADPIANLLCIRRRRCRPRLSRHLSSHQAMKPCSLWGAEWDREMN